jgi:hypothetical protein
MLIKSANDKNNRLALLEDLQKSSLLDAGQKDWLRDELRRYKTGMEGERASCIWCDLATNLPMLMNGQVAVA